LTASAARRILRRLRIRRSSAALDSSADAEPATLDSLNRVDADQARAMLQTVSGSTRWARLVAAARPFNDAGALYAAAERAFDALTEADWREAFAVHAPIGAPRPGQARDRDEQSGVATLTRAQRDELQSLGDSYRWRFGYVFLIRARGRDLEQMLAALRQRLGNDPATELAVAAGQEREIVRLRLRELAGA
jgi:OHCU decarboxylase